MIEAACSVAAIPLTVLIDVILLCTTPYVGTQRLLTLILRCKGIDCGWTGGKNQCRYAYNGRRIALWITIFVERRMPNEWWLRASVRRDRPVFSFGLEYWMWNIPWVMRSRHGCSAACVRHKLQKGKEEMIGLLELQGA